jgi:protein-tyrosine-phosphatase
MIRQRSATVLSRDGLSLARDAGSPTSSESEEPVVAGGSSSPGSSRCASPTRRGNSRLQFFALDVRPDSPAQRRDKITPYGGGLERIPSGELGDMCDMGDRGAALFGHRRGRRLAAVGVASIVILCCVVSRSSSLALAVNGEGNDAAGRRSAPSSWQGTASTGAESGDKHGLRPFRMLTVCTGNTCRSPMMMALLRMELQRLGLKNILVESAGTGEKAALRRPASPHALTLFPEQLEDHQSRRITEKHLSVYDRIFCMTDAHKDAVVEQCMQEAKNASYLRYKGGGLGLSRSLRKHH